MPTNALMVVGRVVMAERHGVSKRGCLASIVYEVGLAVVTAVMVGAYFVITLPQLDDKQARYAILIVVPLALFVLHPRVFRRLADFALAKLGRPPLPATLPFGRVLELALVYLVGWVAMGGAVVAFASSLHPLDSGDIAYAAAAYPVAFCAAVVTFVVPGGLGTRDAALALSLAAVLPGAVATAIAVGFRIFQTVIELLYVAAVTALARRAPDMPIRLHYKSLDRRRGRARGPARPGDGSAAGRPGEGGRDDRRLRRGEPDDRGRRRACLERRPVWTRCGELTCG